jgi:hypothetical protein
MGCAVDCKRTLAIPESGFGNHRGAEMQQSQDLSTMFDGYEYGFGEGATLFLVIERVTPSPLP